ncbi:hypothetical protein sscle_06g054750 [Sclerotinia sclerotiorum 1980 UF-70]|uniref:Uncharacterized protein n=1 Tax=Sclerotinia sclerotiorum (strain ATCC 18683 / 1980 / Ss-1) TaxID=665079 RepID=A0A1D9Q6Z9_SCLS1|nr:hypothetical protein sscle_06g054750 [Sclerotinia sclerotiorum 1980 UF-70]
MPKRASTSAPSSSTVLPKKPRQTVHLIKNILYLDEYEAATTDHTELVELFGNLQDAHRSKIIEFRNMKNDIEKLEAKADEDEHEIEKSWEDVENYHIEVTYLFQQTRSLNDEIGEYIRGNESYTEENSRFRDIIKALKSDNKKDEAKIANLEAQIAKGGVKTGEHTAAPKYDPYIVKQQAKNMAQVMRDAIKLQMKWAPSCKTSGKRWSYTSMVPSADVFYKLFRLDRATELRAKKKWKQKKISIDGFEDMGTWTVTIRYNSLELVSNILLKFDAEKNSFTVSGKYGVPSIRV